ncbi:MAG: thioredoxin family protein [Bacteroidota bacterium]
MSKSILIQTVTIKLFIIALLIQFSVSGFSQITENQKIYNPDADAKKELQDAIKKAKAENKHVFIQIGGNWCPWCIKFHNFVKENQDMDSLLNANYVVLKINHSKENENQEILTQFEFPQRFGFPVFVILDKSGKRIHTQNSGLLEKDKSYSKNDVMQFFNNWTPTAINPNSYKK